MKDRIPYEKAWAEVVNFYNTVINNSIGSCLSVGENDLYKCFAVFELMYICYDLSCNSFFKCEKVIPDGIYGFECEDFEIHTNYTVGG